MFLGNSLLSPSLGEQPLCETAVETGHNHVTWSTNKVIKREQERDATGRRYETVVEVGLTDVNKTGVEEIDDTIDGGDERTESSPSPEGQGVALVSKSSERNGDEYETGTGSACTRDEADILDRRSVGGDGSEAASSIATVDLD
ncbi:hypothetical protein BHE90_017593 [Fusarium euwallaceae]|uniref:Uncharacterized protein n=1 Tax=Fusarium euwallaceae TaxID=1147111 RepID=A0A430KX14_9HYPO|nr:hypothetical protein BHE90_017593 [Fusarium euwallaceae]